MNDKIDEINARNKELNEEVSPGDQSRAKFSEITHPDEDKKKMAEGIIAELGNHTQEIDDIKKMINDIAIRLNELTNGINQLAQGQMQPPQGVPGQPPGGLNMEALGQLGDLAEKAVSAYKQLKGNPAPAESFIDQNYINEQVKKSVMGNFEIGEALISNLKSKLVNKAVASQVSDAMKATGHDDHAPQ